MVVGADKGGVGKTTISRLLLDYVGQFTQSVRAFDTEPGGVLTRFFPKGEVVNLSEPPDQAKVIDGMGDARITLIDCRAGLLTPTLQVLRKIGFKHGVEAHLAVFHILGNTAASISEIGSTAGLLSDGGDHVLVKNRAGAGRFFEWDQDFAKKYFDVVNPAAVLEIDNLDATSAEKVDRSNQSFKTFINDTANGRTYRGYVDNWVRDGFEKLDRIGVRNLANE